MTDHLSEIPLPGRVLAPSFARIDSSSSKRASLGFTAGAENRLVASAVTRLMRFASHRRDESAARHVGPKLLALFGPSGTGKTHLALGLVRYWNEQRGNDTAAYLTAADFYHQYIEAIKHSTVADFRRTIRECELLTIDDLHRLPTSDHVSQELRFALDAFEDSGGMLVVTSRLAPSTLANISADVRSRLASGLILRLDRPGEAARVRIVRQASETLGLPLSEQVADYLARNVGGTANELFGAMFDCCAVATGRSAREAAGAESKLAARLTRQVTLREILAVVARYFGLPQAQLKSNSRRQSIVTARAIAVYLAREFAGASYEQIGRALGGRDHTTIIYNFRKIERTRSSDPLIQEALDELRRILRSR